MTPAPLAFDAVRDALGQAKIRYAIGGSWASTAFGQPRFTNDIDILAELNPENLPVFLRSLPSDFYADPDEAMRAVRAGRPFNIIHAPTALKFDLFPASAFPLGDEELERAIALENTGLSTGTARFVTPEDILLAKLHWFRAGGEASQVQWRDIEGLVRACAGILDHAYLRRSAPRIGVEKLLERILPGA